MTIKLGIQAYQIFTNDEVCIPSLSSILFAVCQLDNTEAQYFFKFRYFLNLTCQLVERVIIALLFKLFGKVEHGLIMELAIF